MTTRPAWAGPTQEEFIQSIINAGSKAAIAGAKGTGRLMNFLSNVGIELDEEVEQGPQVVFEAIKNAKDWGADKVAEMDAEEMLDEDDYNVLKMFLAESGKDIFQMTPESKGEVAMEIAEEAFPIANLLPLIAALPPGGVRKALMKALDSKILQGRKEIDELTSTMKRIQTDAEFRGTKNKAHTPGYADRATKWYEDDIKVVERRIREIEAKKADLENYRPRVFQEASEDAASSSPYMGGKPLGWDFPYDELEDVLYHVTTEAKGLDIDPMLYGISSGDIPGLVGAGGSGAPGVSLLSEPADAVRLLQELKRIKKAQNTGSKEEFIELIRKIAAEDRATYGESHTKQALKEALHGYNDFMLSDLAGKSPERGHQLRVAKALHKYRDTRGGDPLIFADDLANSKIEMLAIPKSAIPANAKINVHMDAAGREIRVHSDIPTSRDSSRELLRKINLRDEIISPLERDWRSFADDLAVESLNRAVKDGMLPEMVELHKYLSVTLGKVHGLDRKGGYYKALRAISQSNPAPQELKGVITVMENEPVTLMEAWNKVQDRISKSITESLKKAQSGGVSFDEWAGKGYSVGKYSTDKGLKVFDSAGQD